MDTNGSFLLPRHNQISRNEPRTTSNRRNNNRSRSRMLDLWHEQRLEREKTLMPNARATDPVESHLAAASLDHFRVSNIAKAIHKMLQLPMSDEELVEAYKRNVALGLAPKSSESGIRTRRNELYLKGLIRVVGVATNGNGRQVRIWESLEK